MKFAALGRTRWLHDAIIACAEAGHVPVLIATAKPAPEYDILPEHFRALASRYSCPFIPGGRLDSVGNLETLCRSNADVAISVNWPGMISGRVLDMFPHGVLNAHMGDLPRFRGNACPNWAILSGESRVVLSIHRMVEDLDAGPVFLKRQFPIDNDTYIFDVYGFANQSIPDMFRCVIDGLATESLAPIEQSIDPAACLRCFPRQPDDSLIDWTCSAESICRLVRSSAEPFSGAYTYNMTEKIMVWRARAQPLPHKCFGIPGQVVAINKTTDEVAVLTGKGLLILEIIEIASTGRIKPAVYIHSTRTRLGLNLELAFSHLLEKLNTAREPQVK